jgi:5'-3' exonuclease
MSTHTDLYLIDASVYVFRAWFSVPDNFNDHDGNPTNAVFGFAGFLVGFLEQVRPSHIGVAFDESLETSFRNDIYPDYKANRDPAPLDLKRQFAHCRAFAEALGISCFSDDRYEADDLIGTLAHRKRPRGHRVHVVSSDKDLAQLVNDNESLWDFARNQRLDGDGIEEKFGVRPEQIADYLALTGDSVDNIPGVPGVGPKTASALLQHFGTLDDVLGRIDEVPFLSIRGAKSLAGKLREHTDKAQLARQLTGIALDAPIPEPEPELDWRTPDMQAVEDLFDYLRFGTGLRERCRRLAASHLNR